ncbi:hypothetical protein WUBG_06729 [Wuchereria bancrofti]|uniref:Uncharacterized protein n=1 Tax=Wuchereria bancrofti TaxID=6293 RepID=J9B5P8_WUCBA|nr:hypothetical protein WUBG_06729 [Wuchereria bancrofti]
MLNWFSHLTTFLFIFDNLLNVALIVECNDSIWDKRLHETTAGTTTTTTDSTTTTTDSTTTTITDSTTITTTDSTIITTISTNIITSTNFTKYERIGEMVSIDERRNDKNGIVKSDNKDEIRNETRKYLISTHQYSATTIITNQRNDMWDKLKKLSKSDTIIVTMIFILFIFLCSVFIALVMQK